MFDAKCYEGQLKEAVSDLAEIWEVLDGRSILVTGATGLIGSALTDVLCCAHNLGAATMEVYAAARNLERMQRRFQTWDSLCLMRYEAAEPLQWTQKFDYVLHCAGNGQPGDIGKEPVETMMGSMLGLYHLLEHLRKGGSRSRVLYVSTSEIYGLRNNDSAEWYTEEDYGRLDILNVRACYPSGRRAAETLSVSYIEEYGLDIVIARPGHIYGPNVMDRDSRVYAQFIRDALAGRDIVMKSQGTQLRSYCYVLDCATAMLTLLASGERGRAYNISNKESVVTIRQLAEEIAGQAGRKVVCTQATEFEKKSYNLMDVSALNAEKLESLGWQGRYNLQAGVKATLDALAGCEFSHIGKNLSC